MINAEMILNKIDSLRYKNTLFFTNAYVSVTKLTEILGCADTEIYETDNSVAVRFVDNGVHRLYIFADSAETAASLELPRNKDSNDTIIFEVIEQNNEENLRSLFTSNGWLVYERLVCLTYVLPEHFSSEEVFHAAIEVAVPRDAEAVYRMLYDSFDVNVSHLPSMGQLSEIIGRREATVIRDQDKIAALAICQATGKKTKYFYQLVVDAAYRGKRYAQALSVFEYSGGGTGTTYSLWAPVGNVVIKLHKKIGYREAPRYLTVFSKAL